VLLDHARSCLLLKRDILTAKKKNRGRCNALGSRRGHYPLLGAKGSCSTRSSVAPCERFPEYQRERGKHTPEVISKRKNTRSMPWKKKIWEEGRQPKYNAGRISPEGRQTDSTSKTSKKRSNGERQIKWFVFKAKENTQNQQIREAL